jgi:hypothetical protein
MRVEKGILAAIGVDPQQVFSVSGPRILEFSAGRGEDTVRLFHVEHAAVKDCA